MSDSGTKRLPIHASIGEEKSQIEVRISYRIIELFSEGLYSSPTKAVEELVTNAFDAGAENVHVVLGPDLRDPNATITVIDDGTGMDEAGFHDHWIIGNSRKRDPDFKLPKNRAQIGKFGIGKLATYVLSSRLSHVSKVGGKFYAASMDFEEIPAGDGIFDEDAVVVPFRELTEDQAREALDPWVSDSTPGFQAVSLFGDDAADSWTVTIMSSLKEMATEISLGRLRWVLSTAMPLRDDFNCYLNGKKVPPSKMKASRLKQWRLGLEEMESLPKPAPDELEAFEDEQQDNDSVHRFGLIHRSLGPVTGKVELFEDVLTAGKSQFMGRSHGYFVYVRGRLINSDDEYFGIDSNKLRHGTFSRFRCEVHIDRLDNELRSTRESVRQTSLLTVAQNLLQGVFNVARSQHERDEEEKAPGVRAARRLAASPVALTRRPIRSAIISAIEGDIDPQYIRIPRDLTDKGRGKFLERIHELEESADGFVREVSLVEASSNGVIAVFDAEKESLEINLLHPFVAYFSDEFSDFKRNVPLQLWAVSEVLLEARLYEAQRPEKEIRETMGYRDLLLRHLARTLGRRNALVVSQDLQDAATDKDRLEEELVSAFDSLGFDTVPIGKSGKPDGLAIASLSGTEDGEPRTYRVSLEAKSKEKLGAAVSAKTVSVSTVARHRDAYYCHHAVVVGPDFPTKKVASALETEIKADREKTGRTITLIRIGDLARLVRNAPARRLGLDKLRALFSECSLPEEAEKWIDGVLAERIAQPPYREILDAIAAEQKDVNDRAINYTHVEAHLRYHKRIRMKEEELRDLCRALMRMAPDYVYAEDRTVEITTRPKIILDSISAMIRELPPEDQTNLDGLSL